MRIAILGAGFAGLSAAWHMLKRGGCEVTLFDAKGVGGGASGIAAGLLHPYVGEEGKRSYLATEGVEAALELIDAAEDALGEKVVLQRGIARYTFTEEQRSQFLSHAETYGDVSDSSGGMFWIESGMTIDCPRYLQGLLQAVCALGGQLVVQEVADLSSLEGYDEVLVAAGSGIRKFPELDGLKVSILKGQVLICEAPEGVELPERSSIGKGYLARMGEERQCCVGSTYERGVTDEIPDPETAKAGLFPKIGQFFAEVERLNVKGCKAALRVIAKGHYFPLAGRIKKGLWVLTAMGSRGLLYHGLLGKALAEAVLTENGELLSSLSKNPLKQ